MWHEYVYRHGVRVLISLKGGEASVYPAYVVISVIL